MAMQRRQNVRILSVIFIDFIYKFDMVYVNVVKPVKSSFFVTVISRPGQVTSVFAFDSCQACQVHLLLYMYMRNMYVCMYTVYNITMIHIGSRQVTCTHA